VVVLLVLLMVLVVLVVVAASKHAAAAPMHQCIDAVPTTHATAALLPVSSQ
jgi:hypothetical protein